MTTIYSLFLFIICLLSSFSLSAAPTNDTNQSIKFISLTDIHFDPFILCKNLNQIPCRLIQQLKNSPASEWPAILAAQDKNLPKYGDDTNYLLLTSALHHAKNVAKKEQVQFVIVLGDFLGHNYPDMYRKYSLDHTRVGYRDFVDKTFLFLVDELHRTFPSLNVYIAVGNNDTYHYDYIVEPNGPFLNKTGLLFSSLVKANDRQSMLKTFKSGGYYSIDFPEQKLRLISLNSVLFARRKQKESVKRAALQQLHWLHAELLSAKNHHEKVILIMHVPPGIDIHGRLDLQFLRLIELWDAQYIDLFEQELKTFAPQISTIYAGHLHVDWFQTLTLSNAHKILLMGTPSISPIFFNQPAFKVYIHSPAPDVQLEKTMTYETPLDHDQPQWQRASTPAFSSERSLVF